MDAKLIKQSHKAKLPANTAYTPKQHYLTTPIATTTAVTSDSLTTPQSNQLQLLDPISEGIGFNSRKASLNLPSQRKALALYNAPVVKECYKRVISHFNKHKSSYT